MKMSDQAFALLELLADPLTLYARPAKTPARDQLKRAGYIESYRNRRIAGHRACWRATAAGRAALAELRKA